MTQFHLIALTFVAVWLLLVAARFRKSRVVLIGGLAAVALFALLEGLGGAISAAELGFLRPASWPWFAGLVIGWLALMLAFTPLADKIATYWFEKPPTLRAFRALQESRLKLLVGIVIAWILGGFLEELVFRGIVLRAVELLALSRLPGPLAAIIGICAAAGGAGVIHLYQGSRAAFIVTQLSVLFGILFVLAGYNLWAVILCHGLYDTVAFIRFANKQSRYSKMDEGLSTQ